MKKSERATMERNIVEHGKNLLAIFTDATIQEPTLLCKKLRYYERKAERCTTALCNGCKTEEFQEATLTRIEKAVKVLLGIAADGVFFINRDPRGYALKLYDNYVKDLRIYKDWGGCGILAPDFTPSN